MTYYNALRTHLSLGKDAPAGRPKLARMVWAMMTRGERYKEPVALAA
jgi:hypothetical protein